MNENRKSTVQLEAMTPLRFIDATRGIAILMVILVHTAQVIGGLSSPVKAVCDYGQMGVQLFFLVSAYTLCLSWYARSGDHWRVIDFYIRRLFRIAPLYWLGIPLYAAIGAALSWYTSGRLAIPWQYTPVNVMANILLLHGFYPPANNVIVPGGWSIGTEVAFYMVFPWLMKRVERGDVKTPVQWMIAVSTWSVIVQLVLAALWWEFGMVASNHSFMYTNILVQSQVFLIGIAFYHLRSAGFLNGLNVSSCCIAFVALTSLAGLLWSMHIGHLFSIIPAIAALSFCFLVPLLEMTPRLCPPWLCRIGQLSYSMYLFHFVFAYWGVRWVTASVRSILGPEVALAVSFVVVVALTFLVALVSERYIERPGIALGKRLLSAMHSRAGARHSQP